MTPDQLRVADRITAYLSGGGLFNPELANHDAVRDLLIDARDAHAAALEEIERLNAAWKAQQFHLEAEERESAHWQERAEQAERRAERLKVHAEESHSLLIRAMAYTPTDCSLFDDMHKRLKAYRADKGE